MCIPAPAPIRDRGPPPAPPRPRHAPADPEPTNVVGVFGLSIRTMERDLEAEFNRIAPVEKVTIVYDARVSALALSTCERAETEPDNASLSPIAREALVSLR